MAGRPREFDRDEALACARDAFWSRGYEGTSMSDLVAALGIAAGQIYAAFGTKEELFREAIALYESGEGGFAKRAIAEEASPRAALQRILRDGVEAYTRPGGPRGCMVVLSALTCSRANDSIGRWLAERRRKRTASMIELMEKAVVVGELSKGTDTEALGDYFAAVLRGVAVQARDGVPRARLLALVSVAMSAFDARD